jgi:hypothetical protein
MFGSRTVSLTRSPEIAAHFAFLTREDDDGFGAILVFRRASLAQRHRLVAYHWSTQESGRGEMEEFVSETIEIGRHLIGLVSSDPPIRTREDRHRAYQCRQRVLQMVSLISPALGDRTHGWATFEQAMRKENAAVR